MVGQRSLIVSQTNVLKCNFILFRNSLPRFVSFEDRRKLVISLNGYHG